MFPAQLANHLWQSTVFAGAVWLSTLLLRKNSAAVRYRLWMIAALKFLVPFSLLIAVGGNLGWRVAPEIRQDRLPVLIREMGQPFAPSPIPVRVHPALDLSKQTATAGAIPAAGILAAIWFLGAVFVLSLWWVKWNRVARILRDARPFDAGIRSVGIPILSSPAGLEPGVFGILRPVLLMPEGAAQNLRTAQLEAIIAHEIVHVRRRDNLAAAVHTIVEALFWFHPLVWWLGNRLVHERERACDEAVLESGCEAADYAEGILKVCECYLKAPACMAGVSGIHLKKRIEAIMDYRGTTKLNLGKKLVLAAAGVGILVCPLAVGMMHAAEVGSASVSAVPAPVLEVASKAVVAVIQQNRAVIPRENPVRPAVAREPNVSQQWPEEVQLLITDAERIAFGKLGTDAEREKFVEQFWQQRDPTPGTSGNEFKDEYYRRIAYANEHFTGLPGVPGSKTDRGKIFILNGQPDEIESHPTGGATYRSSQPGGGVTNTFPHEIWRYRNIDRKGDNTVHEFVDQKRNGDYRLEYDPSVKLPRTFEFKIRHVF